MEPNLATIDNVGGTISAAFRLRQQCEAMQTVKMTFPHQCRVTHFTRERLPNVDLWKYTKAYVYKCIPTLAYQQR
jgi:hypothetical protein